MYTLMIAIYCCCCFDLFNLYAFFNKLMSTLVFAMHVQFNYDDDNSFGQNDDSDDEHSTIPHDENCRYENENELSHDSSKKEEDYYTQSHEELWNGYYDNEKENEEYSTQSQNSFQVERSSSHSKDSSSDNDSESSSSESGISTSLPARKNVKRKRVAKSPPKKPSSDLNLRCHTSRSEHLQYPKCYKGMVTPYYYLSLIHI